jgi:ABC-2 type transport system ATP-binding protein
MNYTIKTNALSKHFKETRALENISIDIEENKLTGLVGRNGAGKTTMLKTFAGHLLPTSGEALIWGEKPFDNLKVLSKVVFADAGFKYDKNLSLNDLLYLGSIHYENWDKDFSKKLLDFFRFNTKKAYRKLSVGMISQFNLIMALSSRAELTMLDEPTLGMDPAARNEFYSIILKDYMKYPRTIILSSHMVSEVENLLEDIILIKEGELVMHESVEVFQNYAYKLSGTGENFKKYLEKNKPLSVEDNENISEAVFKGKIENKDMFFFKENNITYNKMSTEEVCIYLTKPFEGGFKYE